MYRGDFRRKATLAEYGFRLPSCMDNRPLNFEEWDAMRPQTVYVSATPGAWEMERTGGVFAEQVIRPTGLIDPPVDDPPGRDARSTTSSPSVKEVAARRATARSSPCSPSSMAEDLTEYMHEQGVRVRYMHSDIDTLERIEIIRDLRLGAFDVLVGINLLREGLDIPECALVAILDADKEGFLRSRDLAGPDHRPRRAQRRRPRHPLCRPRSPARWSAPSPRPTAAARSSSPTTRRTASRRKAWQVDRRHHRQSSTSATTSPSTTGIGEDGSRSSATISRRTIADLEKRMREAAADLEFEEAARLRDEIKRLEEMDLATSDDRMAAAELKTQETAGTAAGRLGLPAPKPGTAHSDGPRCRSNRAACLEASRRTGRSAR